MAMHGPTPSVWTRTDYKGGKSTLCPGCGHDSISNQIISMAFELGLEQHNVIKLSGIGCSSKTPAYFLGQLTRL
jgi:2-oxoglutarate/2-oxoacid ferredoxin oxidoreductase subunit beta